MTWLEAGAAFVWYAVASLLAGHVLGRRLRRLREAEDDERGCL